MRGRTLGAWGALLCALLASRAAAPQVNTEVLRKRIKAAGATFILEGAFDARTGNTQGLAANGLVGGGGAFERHTLFAFASADYTRLNGTLGVDKSFAHLRYDYRLSPVAWWGAFAQAQSDALQALQIRNLVGTGPRFGLYQDAWVGLYLGAALMLEHDAYDEAVPAALSSPLVERFDGYLALTATLRDGIQVVSTTYVQPRLGLGPDVRLESESGFLFKVSKAFSTGITFTAHFNGTPPPGVLPTDTELKNTLTLTL